MLSIALLFLFLLQLRASLGLQPFSSHLYHPCLNPSSLLPPLTVTHFLAADSADFVAVQFGTAGMCSVQLQFAYTLLFS